jgi:hypothetical protein
MGSKQSKNNGQAKETPSRLSEPTEVVLSEIDLLKLEKLVLHREALLAKSETLKVRQQLLDQEKEQLTQELLENATDRNKFTAAQGLNPNRGIRLQGGKLVYQE